MIVSGTLIGRDPMRMPELDRARAALYEERTN